MSTTSKTINRGWLYTADFRDEYIHVDFRPADWTPVCLPHTNLELPANGFDENCYQFVSSYWYELDLPDGSPRQFIDFEAVMCAADVWVNGILAGSHRGGYTPFSIEISRYSEPGSTARILVRVDSTERPDIPPFGHVVDYLTYGGMYREVQHRCCPHIFIDDAFVRTENVLSESRSLNVEVKLDPVPSFDLMLQCRLTDSAGRLCAQESYTVKSGEEVSRIRIEGLHDIDLWSNENPNLYFVSLELMQGNDMLDSATRRIGFRHVEFRADGFYLNGSRLPLIGLNRHQSFPYTGYAMPWRAQQRDAWILKNELHLNLVRCSHYPQSRHFLDACDELGLLVFEELPGWQHIGDASWQDVACQELEEMIMRDRNRPSIIIWGVRINESADNHDFYERTNRIARELDPDRQTGGVRVIERSEFLEDVYTFNDFTHDGGTRILKKPRAVTAAGKSVPYMVTEHNGHMFPSKSFDNEERLREHALRHARVLDKALGMKDCSGVIGWCAFDYNTHKDFGSGDRICYHGVSDMFRQPKYAAAVYASQVSPEKKIVLEAASLFTKGERSAARPLPIEIYTNCDSIVLYRGDSRIGEFFPDRKTFASLPHPPVVIRDLIGDQLQESGFTARDQGCLRRIVGKALSSGPDSLGIPDLLQIAWIMLRYRKSRAEIYELVTRFALGWGSRDERFEIAGILNGTEVFRRSYGGDARADQLQIHADDLQLESGDWDCTRISIQALDQYGNLHPYTMDAIELTVSGPGSVMGPSLLPLTAGWAVFWLRSHGEAGKINLSIRSGRFGNQELLITVCAAAD
ncbi:glycoside hydrolase family 2 protein [Spirochaeta dissipatitropha]